MGTPGGPLSGDMVAVQTYARESIEQNQGRQPQPIPPQEQPSQETPQISKADLEAAAIQKNLEYNDSVTQDRIDKKLAEQTLAQQASYSEMAQEFAPKTSSDPQLEQQQAQAIQNEQGR